MVNYFVKQFALSRQGEKDLIKAIVACTLTDISLMFPVGVLYMLLKSFVSPRLGGETITPNIWIYNGISVLSLAIYRFEDTSILVFIRYACAFFMGKQQIYEWRFL